MAGRLVTILKEWMLPIAMATGISVYLVWHFTPQLHPPGQHIGTIVSDIQRTLIAVLLFFQFVKVSPKQLLPRKWHIWALLVQAVFFWVAAIGAVHTSDGTLRILLECAMICFICPTAAASGVITDRLGGDLSENVTYLIIINIAATFIIPAAIPLVRPAADISFWSYVFRIGSKIFPILVVPCLAAWLIRALFPRLQKVLYDWAPNSFYVWGVCLTMAMMLATRALVHSGITIWGFLMIVAVSALSCAIQFFIGHRLGRNGSEHISAGQSLGQKNTGFLIWLGYTYLTPVTSVAGGLYAIWQNLFNSWQLYRKEHTPDRRTHLDSDSG